MMRPGRGPAVLVVAAAVLAGCDRAGGNGQPEVPEGQTRINFQIEDCVDCTLEMHDGHTNSGELLGSTTVTNGTATLTVPTNRTAGSTFALIDQPMMQNWIPVVVVRYAGLEVGQPVTEAQAATSTSANGCWAGTDQSEFSIEIETQRPEIPGSKPTWNFGNRMLRAYITPGLPTTGVFAKTLVGGLAHQNVWWC